MTGPPVFCPHALFRSRSFTSLGRLYRWMTTHARSTDAARTAVVKKAAVPPRGTAKNTLSRLSRAVSSWTASAWHMLLTISSRECSRR